MVRPASRRLATRAIALILAGAGALVTLHGPRAAASSLALDGTPHIMQTASQAHAGTAAVAGAVPLTYQTADGPVEAPPVVYLVFWGEQWQVGWTDVSSSGTTYSSNQSMQYITGFFNYIGSSATSWFSSQTQYCSGVAVGTVNCGSAGAHVGNPPTFGGTWIDTADAPPPPVVPDNCAVVVCTNPTGTATDNANVMAQEALNAEKHFGYNANADYMIMLPKATATPGYGYYCAYHGEAIDSSGNKISFTNMPYVLDANTLCGENFVNSTDTAFGNGYMDGYSIVAGHEFAEAATDAQPSTNTAWLDANGQETGDKCAWITPGTPGGAHNIGPDANGHVYAVQTLWSNAANGCV